ncbi:MAG: hypothetical protein RSF40_01375 [Oscillospiraceae bacterium]
MGVSSLRVIEYYISCDCDECDYCDCISSVQSEIKTKQQAIKKAGFHKLSDGRILCQACFEKTRNSK